MVFSEQLNFLRARFFRVAKLWRLTQCVPRNNSKHKQSTPCLSSYTFKKDGKVNTEKSQLVWKINECFFSCCVYIHSKRPLNFNKYYNQPFSGRDFKSPCSRLTFLLLMAFLIIVLRFNHTIHKSYVTVPVSGLF